MRQSFWSQKEEGATGRMLQTQQNSLVENSKHTTSRGGPVGISERAQGSEEFERCNRSGRARSYRPIRALVPFLAAVWVAACGGGGGSDEPPPPPPVSGYVVKGPIAAATVELYSITADGTKTRLGATTSDLSGFYSFNIAPPAGSVILVEASG